MRPRTAIAAAERCHSVNTETAVTLREVAERLQLRMAGLLMQLSKAELEALLRSQETLLSRRMEVDITEYQNVSILSLVSFSSVLYVGVE